MAGPTICAVVPVAYPRAHQKGLQETLDDLLERSWPVVEHAAGLSRAGAKVHLFFDGPFSQVTKLGDDFFVHFAQGADPRWAAHLVPKAIVLRPDLLHIFHFMATPALAASVSFRGPVFSEYNGSGPQARWSRRALSVWATARLDGLFFSAREIAEPFVEAGLIAKRTPILELPQVSSRLVFVKNHLAREKVAPETEGPIILVVARVESPKDPFCALEAFRLIWQKQRSAQLIWVTKGGRDLAAVERKIAQNPEMKVRFVSGLAPDAMALHYAAADVLIHTSRREVCGAAFSEALSMGLPIAASDIPSFRAKADPSAVRLCPLGDAQAFAEAACALMKRVDVRQAARAHFLNRLSFDALGKRRLAAYERALSRAK